MPDYTSDGALLRHAPSRRRLPSLPDTAAAALALNPTLPCVLSIAGATGPRGPFQYPPSGCSRHLEQPSATSPGSQRRRSRSRTACYFVKAAGLQSPLQRTSHRTIITERWLGQVTSTFRPTLSQPSNASAARGPRHGARKDQGVSGGSPQARPAAAFRRLPLSLPWQFISGARPLGFFTPFLPISITTRRTRLYGGPWNRRGGIAPSINTLQRGVHVLGAALHKALRIVLATVPTGFLKLRPLQPSGGSPTPHRRGPFKPIARSRYVHFANLPH